MVLSLTIIKKIPYTLRTLTLLAILYLIGLSELISSGLASDGKVFLIAFVVLFGLLLHWKLGIAALMVAIATIITIGWLMVNRHITLEEFKGLQSYNARNWISATTAFTFMAGTLLISVTYLLEKLKDQLKMRDQYEMDLLELKNKAEAAKSQFLAKMSHEIRTPLNAIVGMMQLLAGSAMDSVQKGYVAIANLASEVLLSVIENVLDFSQIEAGKLKLQESDFNLTELLQGTVSLLQVEAQRRGLQLVSELDPSLRDTNFIGDAPRLRQVLINLVNNAIKFSNQGRITLSVRLQEELTGKKNIRFEVEDMGIGIDEGRIEQLFQPFTQLDSSQIRKQGGTGLGLAISKAIVEQMEGTIGIASKKGKGSTFWFTVNLREAQASPEAVASPVIAAAVEDRPVAAQETSGTKRILLVEDNEINQMITAAMLEKLGYNTDIRENGQEALNAVKTTSYDLILMDIQMPVMDGLEAARLIRKMPQPINQIPIIALTAYATREDQANCFSAGMNDYLTKPILMEKLQRAILGNLAG